MNKETLLYMNLTVHKQTLLDFKRTNTAYLTLHDQMLLHLSNKETLLSSTMYEQTLIDKEYRKKHCFTSWHKQTNIAHLTTNDQTLLYLTMNKCSFTWLHINYTALLHNIYRNNSALLNTGLKKLHIKKLMFVYFCAWAKPTEG